MLDKYYEGYWNNYFVKTTVIYKAKPKFYASIKTILYVDDKQGEEMINFFSILPGVDEARASNESSIIFAFNWVRKNIDYRGDLLTRNASEYWQNPYETFKSRQGDCEDGSILIYWICRYLDVPAWKLRIVTTWVILNNEQSGHAFLAVASRPALSIVYDWYVMDWSFYSNNVLRNFRKNPIRKIPDYTPGVTPVWWSFNEEYEWAQHDWRTPYNSKLADRQQQFLLADEVPEPQ